MSECRAEGNGEGRGDVRGDGRRDVRGEGVCEGRVMVGRRVRGG